MVSFKRCRQEFIKGILFIACDSFLFFMIAGLFTPLLFIRFSVAGAAAIATAIFVFVAEKTIISLDEKGTLTFQQGFQRRRSFSLPEYSAFYASFVPKQVFPTPDLRLYLVPHGQEAVAKNILTLECSTIGSLQFACLLEQLKLFCPELKEGNKNRWGRIDL